MAEIQPDVGRAGPVAFLVAYGLRMLRLLLIHGPPALPLAYGLLVTLGEVPEPAAEALPLSFAWQALGDN